MMSAPISVALGDMPDLPHTAALAARGAAVSGADYVKVGVRSAVCRDRDRTGELDASLVATAVAELGSLALMRPICQPHRQRGTLSQA